MNSRMMMLIASRRIRMIALGVTFVVVGGACLHVFINPHIPKDITVIKCQYLHSESAKRSGETSDPLVIARITGELSKGRFIINSFTKARGIAVISAKDSKGNGQTWILFVGNQLAEEGSSRTYSVNPELEKILRETWPISPLEHDSGK